MLSTLCIESGGFLKPLLIPIEKTIGPSLTNPSVFVDNEKIFVNLRNVNYNLYHSENGIFEHYWGPLCYLHKENEQKLITNNILCELNENYEIKKENIIETRFLDQNPKWNFIGLEDGRLIKWDEKLFVSGVRRDTTENGQGRMELSELTIKENVVLEKNRIRIPSPNGDNSYCEKNWMPVLDRPYTYVKWTNPTEIVEFNPSEKTCSTIKLSKKLDLKTKDLRGGSQVIPFKDNYIAIVHESNLFTSELGKKNGIYTHRFIMWDKNFEIIEISDSFSFLNGKIEFCCGMAEHKELILITFGFQDNAAFILGFPKKILNKILKSYA